MQAPPTLTGARVQLRAATPDDLDAITAIATEPSVSEGWGPQSREKLASELYGDGLDEVSFVIESEGTIAGVVQYSQETDPGFRHAGVDIFLGAAWQGRGLGGEAIELVVRYLFDELDHHRITIDPAVDNVRAVAAYARAGFEPVGVMRQYMRLNGALRDGLLMERLRDPYPRQPAPLPAASSSA